MAKREYRVKIDNRSSKADIKGMDIDPDTEIKTNKSADLAKQDMEFGEAMEADMDRYKHDLQTRGTVDEDWKNHLRFDGNKNLEAGQDLSFTDKMYTPAVKTPGTAKRNEDLNKDNRNIEFGDDNMYFWNSNDDRRSIEQNRQGRDKENDKRK